MASSLTVFATETHIVLRAKAKDAKFIGSSIGGAFFIVRNKLTNETLAQGVTAGSTGNTNLIMNTPQARGMSIADEQTARFEAVIDIDEPTFVRIEAYAPFNHKQSQVIVTTELWIIPGKHILGDGIILEIPGFIIDILEPRTHQFIPFNSLEDGKLKIRANIVMMCG